MYKIGVLLGSFHKKFVESMLEVVKKECVKYSLKIVEKVWVHGSMEKPLMLKFLLEKKNIDGVIILGVIEKGETEHGYVIGKSVASAVLDVQMQLQKPVGWGVLGPGIIEEQIPLRLEKTAKNSVSALYDMMEYKKKKNN